MSRQLRNQTSRQRNKLICSNPMSKRRVQWAQSHQPAIVEKHVAWNQYNSRTSPFNHLPFFKAHWSFCLEDQKLSAMHLQRFSSKSLPQRYIFDKFLTFFVDSKLKKILNFLENSSQRSFLLKDDGEKVCFF